HAARARPCDAHFVRQWNSNWIDSAGDASARPGASTDAATDHSRGPHSNLGAVPGKLFADFRELCGQPSAIAFDQTFGRFAGHHPSDGLRQCYSGKEGALTRYALHAAICHEVSGQLRGGFLTAHAVARRETY